MVFAVRYSTELASPTHRAGCLKTCSPMAAHIHYWLNTTDRPCLFTWCTLQIGCCRGERVPSWISLQKLLLKIPRSMRRPAPKRQDAENNLLVQTLSCRFSSSLTSQKRGSSI